MRIALAVALIVFGLGLPAAAEEGGKPDFRTRVKDTVMEMQQLSNQTPTTLAAMNAKLDAVIRSTYDLGILLIAESELRNQQNAELLKAVQYASGVDKEVIDDMSQRVLMLLQVIENIKRELNKVELKQ